MQRGICYLLIGDRHAVVTTVSVMSLRKWWDGPIILFCGDERSIQYGEKIVGDAGNAEMQVITPKQQRRHVGYATKPLIPQLSPFDQTLQIDGDTLVVGKLDEGIWPQNHNETVLTKFGDWTTFGNIISNRVKKWQNEAPVHVEHSLKHELPAINTGILSYNKGSLLTSQAWMEMVNRKPMEFISDEIAMQLLYPMGFEVRLAHHKFNFSPIYGGDRKGVVIFHFHGKKHVRPEALPIWWPAYQEALTNNFADIRSWAPAGDDRLEVHLKTLGQSYPAEID